MTATPDGAGGATASYVRALIAGGVRVERGDSWERSSANVPARAAVVALEDAAGRTVLLGTTGDARSFVLGRCVAPAGGRRADLGSVAVGAMVTPVTSGFEADLVYMTMARERTPGAAAKLAARTGLWAVRLEWGSAFPEPMATTLGGARGADPGTLIGPVGETALPRLAEGVVDAFDLCRYPSVLKQAPRGVACAYKEMGRCPGPCDGSEGMESYRARVRVAVERMGCTPDERGTAVMAAMREAAAGARFEEAGALKKVLDRLALLDAGVLKGVGTLDRYRNVVVWGLPGRAAARVTAWAGGGMVEQVEMTAKEAAGRVEPLVESLLATPVSVPATADEMDAMGVIFRWGMKPVGRRRLRVVRVNASGGVAAVMEAVRSVGRGSAAGESAAAAEMVEEVEHEEESGSTMA